MSNKKDKLRRKYLGYMLNNKPPTLKSYSKSDIRKNKINQLLNNKKELQIFEKIKNNSSKFKTIKEIYTFFYKEENITDKEILKLWVDQYYFSQFSKLIYDSMPKKERKDNQNPKTNTLNYGSGGNGSNTIRIPSKKRKNKWKNFLKLFPNYKKDE